MPNQNQTTCSWCSSVLPDGYNHSLCKAWKIFLIKQWIDDTENMLMIMYNVVDILEELPDVSQ
jgi:hypothetical protein